MPNSQGSSFSLLLTKVEELLDVFYTGVSVTNFNIDHLAIVHELDPVLIEEAKSRNIRVRLDTFGHRPKLVFNKIR